LTLGIQISTGRARKAAARQQCCSESQYNVGLHV